MYQEPEIKLIRKGDMVSFFYNQRGGFSIISGMVERVSRRTVTVDGREYRKEMMQEILLLSPKRTD